MNLRGFEKSEKFGYIFIVSYDGKKFDSFDEMMGKKTVKGEFKKELLNLNFSWAKGIQQGGRTDAKVSAEGNMLYVSSNYNGEFEEIIKNFNKKLFGEIFIKRVLKTLPNLNFPECIESREYIYRYPKNKIKADEKDIQRRILELNGKKDVSIFTDKKGEKLKEHIREVQIRYENKVLYFKGNSFMPKQVRNMVGYIFTGEIQTYPGKYLSLDKINLKKEWREKYIVDEENLKIDGIDRIERTADSDIYIFYLRKGYRGEFIAKHLKEWRKKLGKVIVRSEE